MPNDILGRDKFNTWQFCRRVEERIRTSHDTRRNHSAKEVARFRDNIKGRRRANVNHNQRPAVLLEGSHGIDNPVRADCPRVFVVELDTRLDTWSDHERANLEITLAHLYDRHNHWRHDRRYYYVLHVGNLHALIAEEVINQHAVFVAGLLSVRRDSPMLHQVFTAVGAHNNIAVANVNH